MKDSPCRGCAKEETCGTPCAKFDVYFRMKWRDIRAMFSVEDAPVASPTRGGKTKTLYRLSKQDGGSHRLWHG